MAELQAVAAAGEVARLALGAIIFLKKVADADEIAKEVNARVSRLKQVLDSTRVLLEARLENGVVQTNSADRQTEENIIECIEACRSLLKGIETKVGGFNAAASRTTLLARFKLACRHSGINKIQTDIEARISALQTDLSLLQLSDQAHTHRTIGQNHDVLVNTLETLRQQICHGYEFLDCVPATTAGVATVEGVDNPTGEIEDADPRAIESLANCMQRAEDLHERYTSEYAPDSRSELFHRDAARYEPLVPGTPPNEANLRSDDEAEPSFSHAAEDEPSRKSLWPLPILNSFIEGARSRASREREQGHFKQAEEKLYSAIRYCEMREQHYGIPFTDAIRLLEEVAQLYQQQGKYSEAVAHVHRLLRGEVDDFARARQNQILAGVYFERHQIRADPDPSYLTADLEKAEDHATEAFITRFELLEKDDAPIEEAERHRQCTALLVRILETRDKTLEAFELGKTLSETTTLSMERTETESMSRVSSVARPTSGPGEFVVVEDKHQLLCNAIKSGDFDCVQSLLADGIDVEKTCKRGKTPLFHAIENSDETIVHKLLDPTVGADVNMRNIRGETALHLAAALGLHDMVRCLAHHDADLEARDKRIETPLLKAVQNDRLLVLQILYDSDVDMQSRNIDEWSALHFALRLSTPTMSRRLLDFEPGLRDAVDVASKTALHHCAEMELQDQMKALLEHEHHLDVSAPDSVQRTPLYIIASKPWTQRREDLVALLVKHGARIDEKRAPPRWRDYAALRQFQVPRRSSKISRHDSVSTEGSIGSTSTAQTKLSSIFSRIGRRR